MKLITLIVSTAFLASCDNNRNPTWEVAANLKSTTAYPSDTPSYSLSTVTHDGHLWVIRGAVNSPVVHHPDCPCAKK